MDLVVYGAAWCNPCKQLKRHLDKINVPYSYIDVQENNPHNFRNVPTVTLENNGKIVDSFVGFDLNKLKTFIGKLDT